MRTVWKLSPRGNINLQGYGKFHSWSCPCFSSLYVSTIVSLSIFLAWSSQGRFILWTWSALPLAQSLTSSWVQSLHHHWPRVCSEMSCKCGRYDMSFVPANCNTTSASRLHVSRSMCSVYIPLSPLSFVPNCLRPISRSPSIWFLFLAPSNHVIPLFPVFSESFKFRSLRWDSEQSRLSYCCCCWPFVGIASKICLPMAVSEE